MRDVKGTAGRLLLACGRGVLAILLCVATAAALAVSALQPIVRRELYVSTAAKENVTQALYADALEFLESECLFYDLPFETLSTALTADMVETVLTTRMGGVYDVLRDGGTLPPITPDPEPFKAAIDTFFETLPEDEKPLDDAASATIAKEIADGVALVLGMGIGDKLTGKVSAVFSASSPLMGVMAMEWLLWLVVGILTAISLIPLKSRLYNRAYTTAGALFIGSALTAAPTWLFAGLDFPAQLALGESALREYVKTMLYTIIGRMQTVFTVAFVISGILLIAAVVGIVHCQKEGAV